jgi:hypothetical protein
MDVGLRVPSGATPVSCGPNAVAFVRVPRDVDFAALRAQVAALAARVAALEAAWARRGLDLP